LRAKSAKEQQQHFLDLWTLKEAYIKACGKGLAIPLRSISFTLDAADLRIEFDEGHVDDPLRWQFWQLALGATHQVGLALADAALPEVSLCCRSLIDLQPGPLEEPSIIRQSMRSQERMYSRTNLEP
jgi:4'-phosphopantetheinyl transferase